jgi:hypothetical protein
MNIFEKIKLRLKYHTLYFGFNLNKNNVPPYRQNINLWAYKTAKKLIEENNKRNKL